MDEKVKEEIEKTVITVVDIISGVFTGLPLASFGHNIKSVYQAYNEQLFNEKVTNFFAQSATVDDTIKANFKLALKEDHDNFMKRLWTIIDRIDDQKKTEILGKVFKAVLKNRVTREDFLRISAAVERIYITDLEYYIKLNSKNYNIKENKEEWLEIGKQNADLKNEKQLTAIGLLDEVVKTGGRMQDRETLQTTKRNATTTTYYPTRIGKILAEYGL